MRVTSTVLHCHWGVIVFGAQYSFSIHVKRDMFHELLTLHVKDDHFFALVGTFTSNSRFDTPIRMRNTPT